MARALQLEPGECVIERGHFSCHYHHTIRDPSPPLDFLDEPKALDGWLQHMDGMRGCSICLVDLPRAQVGAVQKLVITLKVTIAFILLLDDIRCLVWLCGEGFS